MIIKVLIENALYYIYAILFLLQEIALVE